VALELEGASAELDLGAEGKFFPSDDAIAQWHAAAQGELALVYGREGAQ
jgi:DNA polymerase III subunit alpha